MTNASVIMPQSAAPAAKPGGKGANPPPAEGGEKSFEFSEVFAAVTGEARTLSEAKAERASGEAGLLFEAERAQSETAEMPSLLPPDLLAALTAVLPAAQARSPADMQAQDAALLLPAGARPLENLTLETLPMSGQPQDALPWEGMPQQPAQWLQPPQAVAGRPQPSAAAVAASAALPSLPEITPSSEQVQGGEPMPDPATPTNTPPAAPEADGAASANLLAALNRDLLGGSAPLRQASAATAPIPQQRAEQPADELADTTALPADPQKAQAAASAAPPAQIPAVPQRPQKPEGASAADRLANTVPSDMPETQARPASAGMAFQERGEGRQSGSGDTAQFALAARQTQLTVARNETHLLPGGLASASSPMQQLTSRIAGEFDPSQLTQGELAQEPGLPSSATPVKTLSIRLDPPELGSLSIRMSLKDDVLQLQVEASRQETAALLQRDQETLQKMLRSAGYGLDGMTVQITSADRGGNPPAFNGAGQFQQPGGQNQAWRQEERPSGDSLSQRQEGNGNGEAGREADTPVIDPRRGGSVYL